MGGESFLSSRQASIYKQTDRLTQILSRHPSSSMEARWKPRVQITSWQDAESSSDSPRLESSFDSPRFES